MGKRDFLEPLSWDFLPSKQVLETVECVLLLFDIGVPSHVDSGVLWNGIWAAWIVKNIDAHISGWEWMASNEPIGLFTKPYDLHVDHLERVQKILQKTHDVPPTDHSWQRMKAYLLLRNWADFACKYLHMIHHCLPTLPVFAYMKEVTKPPKRTPQQNIWFKAEPIDGIPYFYNRITQQCVLHEPTDFDGHHIAIPRTIQLLMEEYIMNDPALRSEMEDMRMHLERDTALKEDNWVECQDFVTKQCFYYNFTKFKISFSRPKHFVIAKNSPAYQAVLSIQSAYRMKKAKKFVFDKKQRGRCFVQ